LVVAAHRPDQRAYINNTLLSFLRYDNAKVRVAAIECQMQILDRLGEEWTSMLSQMLPFISEAQEDGDEEVEKKTRQWIKKLEDTIGEGISGMLQ
jgi:U3 small nucleolar RNA-associated protein 10